jgi:hypothetical protein
MHKFITRTESTGENGMAIEIKQPDGSVRRWGIRYELGQEESAKEALIKMSQSDNADSVESDYYVRRQEFYDLPHMLGGDPE